MLGLFLFYLALSVILTQSFVHRRANAPKSIAGYFSTKLFAKKKKSAPVGPEFSRVLNVAQVRWQKKIKTVNGYGWVSLIFSIGQMKSCQVPERRPVLCKLLAKEKEREGLAERFDIPELLYFAANVTVCIMLYPLWFPRWLVMGGDVLPARWVDRMPFQSLLRVLSKHILKYSTKFLLR